MKPTIYTLILAAIILTLASCSLSVNTKHSNNSSTTLADFLKAKNYVPIHLHKNVVGHYTLRVRINNDSLLFILDTGANGTCIDNATADKMGLSLQDVAGQAVGYGGSENKVRIGKATINIDSFTRRDMEINAIDLNSINQAYLTEGSNHIDGIIGTDILSGGSAIIDYQTNTLYLKK